MVFLNQTSQNNNDNIDNNKRSQRNYEKLCEKCDNQVTPDIVFDHHGGVRDSMIVQWNYLCIA